MHRLSIIVLFILISCQLVSSHPKRERRLVLKPGKIEPAEGVEGSGEGLKKKDEEKVEEGSAEIEGSGQHHVEGSGVEGSGLVEGSGSVEGSGIDTVLTLEEAKEKKAEKTGGVVEEKLLSLSGDFKREAKKEKKEKD
ncbi:unnamed protein product, partial [Mesorhabditis belari]|uniref:Uncharacterized protein n=1 Tax=Mesorhabditis belari TaxID=2138241 RepID=A0AAF3FBX5_9BILA